MAKWVMSQEVARELAERGRKRTSRSIQKRARSLPVEVDSPPPAELYLATLETGWTVHTVTNGKSYLTATARLDDSGEQVTARSVAPSYYAGTSESYKQLVLWHNTNDDTWWAVGARLYVKPGRINVQASGGSNNAYIITIEYTE